MNNAQPKQYFAATQRAVSNALTAGAIEWEELPSLVRRVNRRSEARGANDSEFMHSGYPATASWDNTMPAALEPQPVSHPFIERIEGLVTREVLEPGVFDHFFGIYADE